MKASPPSPSRNDECMVEDNNNMHSEMLGEGGQVRLPTHQLTSYCAGGSLASNNNADNVNDLSISNNGTTSGDSTANRRQRPRRDRRPIDRYTDGAARTSPCEVTRGLGLICDSECGCKNSVPRTPHERVVAVTGLDVDPTSLGVIARRELLQGEIATVFGETAFIPLRTCAGQAFSAIHERLARDGAPLQYSFQYHLAGDDTGKYWAIPKDDRVAVCKQPTISSQLRAALGAVGGPGVGQLINHTCCQAHCNAELFLTKAVQGDPQCHHAGERLVLAVRATRRIAKSETLLIHYNPRQGIQSWENVFRCRCCKCRGVCSEDGAIVAAQAGLANSEQAFARAVAQADTFAGMVVNQSIALHDFVVIPNAPHLSSNVIKLGPRRSQIRSFCSQSKKCIEKFLPTTCLEKTYAQRSWTAAATYVAEADIVKVSSGGWLSSQTVNAACRWTLCGDTAQDGLSPCPTRNWYMSTDMFVELRTYANDSWNGDGPLLEQALEWLTGIEGLDWTVMPEAETARGDELQIPALRAALRDKSSLSLEEWRRLKISGLQSKHFVRSGGRVLTPVAKVRSKATNCLRNNGLPMDLHMLDNLFAICNPGVHYFTLHFQSRTASISICDSLAQATTDDHARALILTWAVILASARQRGSTWEVEPVLQLSEHEILRKFKHLLLHRRSYPASSAPLTTEETSNLRRMGIRVAEDKQCTTGHWTWRGAMQFPQQGNGNDCGLAAIAAVLYRSRNWTVPSLGVQQVQLFRKWLAQAILRDSQRYVQVPCSRCGDIALRPNSDTFRCRDTMACNARLDDDEMTGGLDSQELQNTTTSEARRPEQECKRRLSSDSGEASKAPSKKGKHPMTPHQQSVGPTSGLTGDRAGEKRKEVPGMGAESQAAQLHSTDVHSDNFQGHPTVLNQGLVKGPSTEPTPVLSPPLPPDQTPTGSAEGVGAKTKVPDATVSSPTKTGGQRVRARIKFQTTLIRAWAGQVKRTKQSQHESTQTNTGGDDANCHVAIKPAASKARPTKRRAKLRGRTDASKWVLSTLRQPSPPGVHQAVLHPAPLCAQCSKAITASNTHVTCVRCRAAHYCTEACQRRHWSKHWPTCTTNIEWCPKCGAGLESHEDDGEQCPRCKVTTYCSQECLKADYDIHALRCPLHSAAKREQNQEQEPQAAQPTWTTVPILPQPAGMRSSTGVLVDNIAVIDQVKTTRRRQGVSTDRQLTDEAPGVKRCEDARDELVKWYKDLNSAGSKDAQLPSNYLIKAITKVLHDLGADQDQRCTDEEWNASIKRCTSIALSLTTCLGEERGQRLWDECVQGCTLITICFQGIKAAGRQEAQNMLQAAGVQAPATEWMHARVSVRRRRGEAPPAVSLTVRVQPNESLRLILRGQLCVGQEPVATCVIREDDQYHSYTTLARHQDVDSGRLKLWTKLTALLDIPEVRVRELILLSIMIECPEFEPLDMLIGSPEHPCSLEEAWHTNGQNREPMLIAGKRAAVALGNAFATQEAWAIAGKETFEHSDPQGPHNCLPRGARAECPSMNIQVGLHHSRGKLDAWQAAQSVVSKDGVQLVRDLAAAVPDWWSECVVPMRWETPEQGSRRERDSAICIRFMQHDDAHDELIPKVTAKQIELRLLGMANFIRDQCFPESLAFVDGDIRYQGLTEKSGRCRGMVTFTRRSESTFDVDILTGCILGLHLGNGIKAGRGRAYKWCPLHDAYGETSVSVTSITRACDFWSYHRMHIKFGQRTRGKEWWTINNPKQKLVRFMLKTLQQKPESGAILAHLRLPGWQTAPRMFQRESREQQDQHRDAESTKSEHKSTKKIATTKPTAATDETKDDVTRSCPTWWCASASDWSSTDRHMLADHSNVWSKTVTDWKSMKRQYILLAGDKAGANAVNLSNSVGELKPATSQYWGVWANSARTISEFWAVDTAEQQQDFLQQLREQGKIGLANRGEDVLTHSDVAWWLQWLEWEGLWASNQERNEVITWNIGPTSVDLATRQIQETLLKGASIVMFQEVSFHPGDRRRIKKLLQQLGPDYWCVMEASHRKRTGDGSQEMDHSDRNWKAGWVFAVVTFLHKDVFKQPIRLEWRGPQARRELSHMLQGRVLCLWAPMQSGPPMLIINVHQAGAEHAELQIRVQLALQAMRAKYPDAKGIIGGDFNANANGARIGYVRSNDKQLQMVDEQFLSFVQAIKGQLVSPCVPSRIEESSDKAARLDHVIGLDIEFNRHTGSVAWVGSPYQDHARVAYSIKIDRPRDRTVRLTNTDERKRRFSLAQWQGISHLVDPALQQQARQVMVDVSQLQMDIDQARQDTLKTRQEAAEVTIPVTTANPQPRLPFHSKEQQHLLRKRHRLETALREVNADKGLSQVQNVCLQDLGLVPQLRLAPLDRITVARSDQWKALLVAEIQECKDQLHRITMKQIRKCERQASQQEARAYLTEKRGPSKFMGKGQSTERPEQLKLEAPKGILWAYNRSPTPNSKLLHRIRTRMPTASIQHSNGEEVAIITIKIDTSELEKAEALLQRAQRTWRWQEAIREPTKLLEIMRNLVVRQAARQLKDVQIDAVLQEAVEIIWDSNGTSGNANFMELGNAGACHRQERSWWAQGPGCTQEAERWRQCIQTCHDEPQAQMPATAHITDSEIRLHLKDCRQLFCINIDTATVTVESQACSPPAPAHERATPPAINNIQRKTGNFSNDCPALSFVTWQTSNNDMEVIAVRTKSLLEWEELANISRTYETAAESRMLLKVIFEAGPWCGPELTVAWEQYMQTEGLSPHVHCQHCASNTKPMVVVTPVKGKQRRKTTCFCTDCWQFTCKHTGRDRVADMSFLRNMDATTGRLLRALPYADEEHPRRIRGAITNHEFDQFRRYRLKMKKESGPDGYTNEMIAVLTHEELSVLREWADRVLQDAKGAEILTEEVLNGTVSLLHKGGDTNNKPSDWRPIVLLNTCMQLVYHVINCRLTEITEKENLIVPGQAGGRQGRGVDVNQAKMDWITQEAYRLKQRFFRIDIDFKNAFNSMSQSALWAIMRAYNIPDVDLLEAIYKRTSVRMHPNDEACATITFDTGVAQGSALSPRLFVIFMNALLDHLTQTGKAFNISHGIVGTDQFNNVAFMDDASILAQDAPGANILLQAVRQFQDWSGMRVNLSKTFVVDINGTCEEAAPPQLAYGDTPVKVLGCESSYRYLGYWSKANGDMQATKDRVLRKTEEAVATLLNHPLDAKVARELFLCTAGSVFRFSAAQTPWTTTELDRLLSLWTQAYKRAESLPDGTASDIYVFPKKWGSKELLTPYSVLAQELCNHLQRCLKHDDVLRAITCAELQRAKEEWMCDSFRDLYDEMELWTWNRVRHNKWARTAKACHQLGVRPTWHIDETEADLKQISWASATRSLRKLTQRIRAVGGKRDMPRHEMWRLDDAAQWETLWAGEDVFWKNATNIRAAGLSSILTLQRISIPDGTLQVPRVTRETGSKGHQHFRVVLPKGIKGLSEQDRATLQAWLGLVDWSARGDIDTNGPKPRAHLTISPVGPLKRWLDTKEQQFNIAQADEMKQSFDSQLRAIQVLADQAQSSPDSTAATHSHCNGEPVAIGAALLTWLKGSDVVLEEAKKVVSQVWPKLSYVEDVQVNPVAIPADITMAQLIKAVEERVRSCQTRCVRHQTLLQCICPTCQSKSCVECNASLVQVKCSRCQTCITSGADGGTQSTSKKPGVITSINIHALGDSWIEKVTQARQPEESDAIPEGLQFLAHVRGWEATLRRARCKTLLDIKSEHKLQQAMLSDHHKDILLIPQEWYPDQPAKFETPGWWYTPTEGVRVKRCRGCDTWCEVQEFVDLSEWCIICQPGQKGKKRMCHRSQGQRSKNGDRRSRRAESTWAGARRSERETLPVNYAEGSDEDMDQSDEQQCQATLGLRLRAADPRYITHATDRDRGDVILPMHDIKKLLTVKNEASERLASLWLSTADMGYALEAEDGEISCPQDDRQGKQTYRYLAPAISRYAISLQNRSESGQGITQQEDSILQQVLDLHLKWGKCASLLREEEKEAQERQSRCNARSFVREVTHKQLPWEPDSISHAAFDPDPIPDCNVKAEVGRDFFFHEQIPKADSGYVRVTAKSLWWSERRFTKVWTAEGLTSCTEAGYGWKINSSTWNHLQARWQAQPTELVRTIHTETSHQDDLEAGGYRSPSWRLLKALQQVRGAKVCIGESAVSIAPFFDSAGRPNQPFWGDQTGPKLVLWESLNDNEKQECLTMMKTETNWTVWCKSKTNSTDAVPQAFRDFGTKVFSGKCAQSSKGNSNQKEGGGKHVLRARGWWKRGDVSTGQIKFGMECWTSSNDTSEVDESWQPLKDAWEHDSDKDELSINLQGPERDFWLGTEAGRLGCYEFPGETWAGDGSVSKCGMGAGSVRLQHPTRQITTKVGRCEEGSNSLRPELAAMASALQAASLESDLLYLCDSETALNKVASWIGRGPRASLAKDDNADILWVIVELLRKKTQGGARTFLVKIKAHRGEPLNEQADTQAGEASQLPEDHLQWTQRTDRLIYEWLDKDGNTRTSAWSNAVRNAMRQGGAEFLRQRVVAKAAGKWNKQYLRITDEGFHQLQQTAMEVLNTAEWNWQCMTQLQEAENRTSPAATTWAAEFLLRPGESREILGQWMSSSAIHENKQRRATQIITGSFPCGKWLHKLYSHVSPFCELCRREREASGCTTDNLPLETVAHIQSAGCKAQKESVTHAHNSCWKFLLRSIMEHGEAERDFLFLGEDKDKQLTTLWRDTEIEHLFPWTEVEEAARSIMSGEQEDADGEPTDAQDDAYADTVFGKRRPDALILDKAGKNIFVLEFKRTSDQRSDYRERGEARAAKQHDVLVKSLLTVMRKRPLGTWNAKLITFVGGTCGSVNETAFRNNLKELQVLGRMHDIIRKGLVYELLSAQDKVLCSYYAQRGGRQSQVRHQGMSLDDLLTKLS